MFMHFMGGGPSKPNHCIAIGPMLVALNLFYMRYGFGPRAKNYKHLEGPQEDSDKFVVGNALNHMRDNADVYEEREFHRGMEKMHALRSGKTGRTFIMDEQQYDAYQMELEDGRFLRESRDEVESRTLSDDYWEDVEKWAKKHYRLEKLQDDQRERDHRTQEQKDAEDDAALMRAARAGNGMAAAVSGDVGTGGREGPAKDRSVVNDYTKFVTSSAPVATPARTFHCLCGSEDEKHSCKTKLNIIGLTPDKLQVALAAMQAPQKVSQLGAGDADPRLETAPKEQVFHPAPDKAPSAAAEKPVQKKEEKDSVAQSPPKAVLTKSAKNRAKQKQKKEREAKAPTGASVAQPAQVPMSLPPQDSSAPDSKRSKRQAKLEGVTRFRMTPELETLKWSPERVDKKGQSFQSVRLENGATMLRYKDNTVILLPKRSEPELPLAPSLSVLSAKETSNTPPLSGLSSPTVPSTGSTPPVALQSPTPPQEAKS